MATVKKKTRKPSHNPPVKKSMRNREATKVATAERVEEMYLRRRMTQQAIAEELGVSQSTVSQSLHRLQQDWLERSREGFDEAKAASLRRIDEVEREAWGQFERSKTQTREVRVPGQKLRPGEKPVTERVTTEVEGNPEWLQLVMKCVESRIKLMGLATPQKVEVSGSITNDVNVKFDWSKLYAPVRDVDLIEARIVEVAQGGAK